MLSGVSSKPSKPSKLEYVVFGLAIALGIVWRLPLYLNANNLLWTDEAVNHLTLKHMFQFNEMSYFYFGMRYQGLTEAVLSLLFVPFFGFSALSQKLAGTVVYLLFCSLGFKLIFSYVKAPLTRSLLILLAVFPSSYLYHLAFMAYGGHLLNSFLGFLILFTVFDYHKKKKTRHWTFPWIISSILVLGVYSYKHFLIFYPVLFLFLMSFRGGLKIFEKKSFRNLLIPLSVASTFPILNQRVGEWLQSKSYENINSFMTYSGIYWNTSLEGIKDSVDFVFGDLWPTFFFTDRVAGLNGWIIFLSALFPVFGLISCCIKLKDQSDFGKLLKLSVFHVIVVFASVVFTPFATVSSDLRYLLPIISVVPFLIISTQQLFLKPSREFPQKLGQLSLAVLGVLFIFDTIHHNHLIGIMKGALPWVKENTYSGLISYLEKKAIKCPYTDYPDAYSLALLTHEKIQPSALHLPRIRRYEECAERSIPRTIVLKEGNPLLEDILNPSTDPPEDEPIRYKIVDKVGPFLVLQSKS